MRPALHIIALLAALSGCQTKPEPPGKPTHDCVVTPYDLVECSEIVD